MSAGRNFRVGYWLGDASIIHGGVALYAFRILQTLLASNEPDCQFVLLCGDKTFAQARQLVKYSSHPRAEVVLLPTTQANEDAATHSPRRAGKSLRFLFKKNSTAVNEGRELGQWLDELELNLIHYPMPTPPFPVVAHVPYIVPEITLTKTPYIITAHDVQELRFPEYFSPAQRAIRAMHQWKAFDHAAKIIVSYTHVKADLVKLFNLHEDKIRVCPIPFDSINFIAPTPIEAKGYAKQYSAWTPFLLYPAQTWQHKNHALLFEALATVRGEQALDIRLICTGGINEFYATLENKLEQLRLRDSVLFTGIVPEAELSWLYRNTAAVVIPTEYEAGSFPLYEAIAHAVPVVCSDVTSLPETIADGRFLFNPRDALGLSRLIYRIVADAKFREENIANSVRQAEKLSNANAAAPFYEAYRSVTS